MEPMTPEERFTKIENALQSLTETQARHETEIEKQNAGIRDLIVVSRTFLESQKELTTQVNKLEEMQNATFRAVEEMQNATFRAIDRLTENIDKLIRGRGPNGQS